MMRYVYLHVDIAVIKVHDSQYNFYYDDNGIVRGGQNDGYSADYIRDIYENGDMVDEEGNLQ